MATVRIFCYLWTLVTIPVLLLIAPMHPTIQVQPATYDVWGQDDTHAKMRLCNQANPMWSGVLAYITATKEEADSAYFRACTVFRP
jgi:hypothetical protein